PRTRRRPGPRSTRPAALPSPPRARTGGHPRRFSWIAPCALAALVSGPVYSLRTLGYLYALLGERRRPGKRGEPDTPDVLRVPGDVVHAHVRERLEARRHGLRV